MSRELDEALGRARSHLLQAALAAFESARALAEALQIASGRADSKAGSEPEADAILNGLDELITALRSGRLFTLPPALARSVSDALAREIRRWEMRSRKDPDARLVLRTFLGLQELLWEIGITREGAHDEGPAPNEAGRERSRSTRTRKQAERESGRSAGARGGAPRPMRSPRVQRFDVEP